LISVIKLIQSPTVSVDFWKPNSSATFENLSSQFPFSKGIESLFFYIFLKKIVILFYFY
jgi:hypothetical protein